jgi:hypothetical protein
MHESRSEHLTLDVERSTFSSYSPLRTTCHAKGRRGDRRRMVTFTRIPYAQAACRARCQDRIIYATIIVAMALVIVSLLVAFH